MFLTYVNKSIFEFFAMHKKKNVTMLLAREQASYISPCELIGAGGLYGGGGENGGEPGHGLEVPGPHN